MKSALLAAALIAATAPALAQTSPAPSDHGAAHGTMPGMDKGAMNMGAMNMGGMDPGLMESMDKMNKAMPSKSAGSVDADFVKMMIPHHQAAIDMARIELAKGTDPQQRKLAQEIISAQEKEIAEMKAWLKARNIP